MSFLSIATAKVFEPLLQPSRYKGAWGGRGSGKSHFFGELLVERCLIERGTRAVCIREMQHTLAQSSKLLVEDKIEALGAGSQFRVLNDRIEPPGGGLILFRGMNDFNATSIKSLEAFDVAWIEEAQDLSHRSLALLRPHIWNRFTGTTDKRMPMWENSQNQWTEEVIEGVDAEFGDCIRVSDLCEHASERCRFKLKDYLFRTVFCNEIA